MTDSIKYELKVETKGKETYGLKTDILNFIKRDHRTIKNSVDDKSENYTKIKILFNYEIDWLNILKSYSLQKLNEGILFILKSDDNGKIIIYEVLNGKIINKDDKSLNEFK